ncbi:oleosin-B6 isoform X11 [Drosophila serrata]|uniref:oleosin-B6 isoform X11 n=1 Tax=Drosophila serrata TaxID=7274 RepID=UPI000A1D0C86|nr:oleosin-B6 isoform X11 [Drosophila serrata]
MSFVECYYFISFILIFLILIRAYVCPNHKWKCLCCVGYTQESESDRQGNVFSAEERPNNRYGDIFFIEPGSDEANRIRDQLEKDEKDLPSYDEVMRMCNLTTPTAAAAAGAPVTVPPLQSPLGDPAAPISIAALPAPPYSETDPHSPVAGAATVITMEPIEPSTSRAAQIPTSPASAAAPAAGYQRPETSIVLGANVTSV